MQVKLSKFDNAAFNRGRSWLVELAWMLASALFFSHSLAIWSGLKVALLRGFGARVGTGVLIKPCVQIKFPWKLVVGNDVWIGEHVWIDNLDTVTIGSDVCVSQGAMLLCGSHDFKRETFDLIARPIKVEDGAWICARAIVCPGVTVGAHAVLTAGSVATGSIATNGIYQGNPAILKRTRLIPEAASKVAQ
jgi:putative colanic acid biosynthesis acetyltransferase WcaF